MVSSCFCPHLTSDQGVFLSFCIYFSDTPTSDYHDTFICEDVPDEIETRECEEDVPDEEGYARVHLSSCRYSIRSQNNNWYRGYWKHGYDSTRSAFLAAVSVKMDVRGCKHCGTD